MSPQASAADASARSRRITGVVLAGGLARRLGRRDKAFLCLGGETPFERVRGVLEGLFGPVLVVTEHPERFTRYGVRTVRDIHPRSGPLGGLHAALSALETEHAFLAACDLPRLDPRVVERIAAGAGEGPAVVPCLGGRLEPLHALYARATAPVAEACLRAGVCSMRAFLRRLEGVTLLEEEDFAGIPGFRRSFTNLNDPDELTRLAWEARRGPASG